MTGDAVDEAVDDATVVAAEDAAADGIDEEIGDDTASASLGSRARCTPAAVAVGTAVRDRVATSVAAKPASVVAAAAVRPADVGEVARTVGADDVDATDGDRPVEVVCKDAEAGAAGADSDDFATSDDATGNDDGADSVTSERVMPRLAGSAPAFELPMLRRRTTITP